MKNEVQGTEKELDAEINLATLRRRVKKIANWKASGYNGIQMILIRANHIDSQQISTTVKNPCKMQTFLNR